MQRLVLGMFVAVASGGCDSAGSATRTECTTMMAAVQAKESMADKIGFEDDAQLQAAIKEYEDTTMLKNATFTDATLVGFQQRGTGVYADIVTSLKEISGLLTKSNAFDKAGQNATPEAQAVNQQLSTVAQTTVGKVETAIKFNGEVKAYCAKHK